MPYSSLDLDPLGEFFSKIKSALRMPRPATGGRRDRDCE
ncbi:MAG: hypothetical protein AVDCRST_MAG37-2461 [uncultured Rubrobacteraceae bacterium]|uniref:Uncharacterized protein n=1 Tax=uncultured Rubrobacteraceae bacterium TaxID=349277 RepID=A0A6J4QSA1_9ACTN|nr:MAG: hypothetical protein AVDCRST_MAG37-2461 [uncultured Rubrobacteraceae bacterium]